MSFVLDASVVLAWCLDEKQSGAARPIREALLTRDALVPAIWPFEVLSALLVAERQKRISHKEIDQFLEALGQLPIQIIKFDNNDSVVVNVKVLARKYHISGYDAAYLELAKRLALPLASSDNALTRAAAAEGISCFPAEN
ncbi:MAG: type II toxin-antitoxin system VapC family toxin [Planctomycetes bacterium]|nr:type II toxin-antitoxin system VapC family toxin [Planctomycetota bacterium]